MRIAILLHSYAPGTGGAENAAANLARGLIGRGHEVHVFARKAASDAEGVVLHTVRARSLLPGGRHTAYARAVRRLLERERFDVVHSFTRTLSHDVLRLGGGTHREYLRRMEEERTPLGAWFSRINPKERAILRLEREGLSPGRYRRIVAVSNRVRDEVVREYGVPASDVSVLYNGVDLRRYRPELRGEVRSRMRREFGLDGSTTLLFCGTGFMRKGLRYAIEAAARVEGAVLLVAGSGDTTPFRAQAERLGIPQRVRFLGPRTGVAQLYAAADLLIHPSLYDPFPNVCLEAMACGTPVLTTAVTGVAELIRDGENSFVVEEGRDVAGMAERIRRLRDLPHLGGAAAATARERSLERNLEENLALYRTLESRANV